ncbi:hypothetical protein [Acinetobacter colistiniresistens]|uniref:hypothetical protein n=1 Tax=Acinetobacter colistiniresistens TaxID=280145 RepID=UPI000E5C0F04|nr:hypothetical protein [Acinetobacter colistiniresistens]
MNDFFLANNESLPHVFVDHEIHILQIQVKNLERFAVYANEIKNALESYSIETITPLIEPQLLNIMGLCSLVTDISPDTFLAHTAQISAIAELVLKIIQVNDAFFKKEERRNRSIDETDNPSWFYAFAYLVRNGHQHDDLMNLTYGAFLQYLKEAQALERQQIKSYAVATRVANHTDRSGFEKYLKQLDG